MRTKMLAREQRRQGVGVATLLLLAGSGDARASSSLARSPLEKTLQPEYREKSMISRSLSTSSSGSVCTEEFTACGDDPSCLDCTTAGDVNVSECLAIYPWQNQTEYFCHIMAATFCCSFLTLPQDTATYCTGDGPAMDYLTCTLEEKGCRREDMPCYGNETVGIASTDPPSGTTSPVGESRGDTNATPAPASPTESAEAGASASIPSNDGEVRAAHGQSLAILGSLVAGFIVASCGPWL